ncbi:histidine phosphatase family protein [Isoptericola sp. 4D.3]|uniref:Histidine phosphatase family protein n=1 Tax=Isoptericola peretonis TaxID=2918523 RepID=A0ABT0J319_9MICO|nr:histidine phosphatase family protein [Isoptericola sp. 4D.3]
MPTRHLHVLRHGAADPFGELTEEGERQAELAGRRLAAVPVDVVWHSPLPRAVRTAEVVGAQLPGARVVPAAEAIDHVPHVPRPVPAAWAGFFDGYDTSEAAEGERLAAALTTRFARAADVETHEVLVTHAFQVAWLVRDALGAPPEGWLGLPSANAGLTTLEYRDDRSVTLVAYNDLGHLPPELRWTGFGPVTRP